MASWSHGSSRTDGLRTGGVMSEEAVRQTRSQKRALEKDVVSPTSPGDKKVKLEGSDPAEGGTAGAGEGDGGPEKAEEGPRVAASLLGSGEVKATIKVEVQTRDEPVDMSTYKSDIKSERQPPSPDDVIVLSDNEPPSPPVNGLNHFFKKTDTDKLMQSSPDERERFIQQLKEELRLQEARLVLLKKLRHSQTQKDTAAPKSTVATPPPLVRGSMTPGSRPLQVSSGRGSGAVIPPPLVRGGQHVPSKLNSQISMPPLVRGAQQMHTLRQQQQQQHSGSGPPPLLLAPRATVPNVQVQGQRIIQQGLIRVANVPNTNVMVNIPQASPTNLKASPQPSKESTASRQAAAKLALCKQLEKTLLEIPPPKPPAPELNFLPSAANNEFIYLVGLEEVVQNLLDTLGRGKQLGASLSSPSPKEPFSCSQCKTDFTSRWRKEKAGGVMCDQCMSSNQKKSLKAEHTNRLKAAFVKALQQEQEMEQRILQQAATSASAAAKSGSSPALAKSEQQAFVSQQYKQGRSQQQQQQQQQHRASQPVVRHHSTIKQSPGQLSRSVQSAMGSRGVSHTFSTSSQLQNAVTTAAAALVSRPGKQVVRPAQGSKVSSSAAPASSWRKQTGGNTGVTMAYVNPSLSVHKSSSSAVERQREYLLDMIPSRPLSQTANTWK